MDSTQRALEIRSTNTANTPQLPDPTLGKLVRYGNTVINMNRKDRRANLLLARKQVKHAGRVLQAKAMRA